MDVVKQEMNVIQDDMDVVWDNKQKKFNHDMSVDCDWKMLRYIFGVTWRQKQDDYTVYGKKVQMEEISTDLQ